MDNLHKRYILNMLTVVNKHIRKRLSPYNFCHWSARRTWLVALVRTSQSLSFDGFLQGVE